MQKKKVDKGFLLRGLQKFRRLAIGLVLAFAVTTCLWGVANAVEFKDNTLHGYGCLTTVSDFEAQLDQLVFDGKGKKTSGDRAY